MDVSGDASETEATEEATSMSLAVDGERIVSRVADLSAIRDGLCAFCGRALRPSEHRICVPCDERERAGYAGRAQR